MKIKKFLFGGPTADRKEIKRRNEAFDALRKKTAQAGLKALGWLGNVFNTVLTAGASSDFGQTSPFVNMDRHAIAKARENTRLKTKDTIEKASPYISPSNHIVAWTLGSFNPVVGALKLEQLGPEAQLAGAVFDIATLSKGRPAIKGTVRAIDKGLARAGNKRARGRVIAREIDKAIESPINQHELSNQIIEPLVTNPKGSGKLVHYDNGDGVSVYRGKGATVRDNQLYPGQTTREGQANYTWWNTDIPYMNVQKAKQGPLSPSRYIIVNDNGLFVHPFDVGKPVGLSTSKGKGFIIKSERVTDKPVDLSNALTFLKSPFGWWEKVKYTGKKSNKLLRVIPEGTYPMYRGPRFYINSVVNLDGTINPRQAMRILHSVAKQFPGAYKMEHRLENPEWHKTDPTTYDHTKQVARSAWQLPIPKGFTKQDLMVAALGHDFGKMIAGEGHALIGADLARQVFPDLTDAQYTAIAEHMGLPKTPLGKVTKLADIDNGRSYVTDKKGNRLLITQHNLWASQYGYTTLPYNLAGSNIRTNRAVRSTIARHNSFYRGINPKMAEPADIQHYMESLAEGKRPTTQGFIRFAATSPRSEGAGIFVSPFSANSSIYGNGITNLVRRKYKLGPDRNLWFKEGDFEVQSIYAKLKDFSNSPVFNPWERISYPFKPKPNNGTASANELLLFDNMHYVGPRSYKATGETTNKTNVTVWNEKE